MQGIVQMREQCGTGYQGHAALGSKLARPVFQSEATYLRGRGTNEDDARCFTAFGELRVLGKKAVPGKNSLRARGATSVDHLIDAQVVFRGVHAAQADGFIGGAHMQGVAIRVCINGNTLHAHSSQGPHRADSDFSAIGDQDGGEDRATSGISWLALQAGEIGAPASEGSDLPRARQSILFADEALYDAAVP
jgi:hypothetical protein